MKKYFLGAAFAAVLAVALVFSFNSQKSGSKNDLNVSEFTVATWNVENLFDMKPDGTEYPEYIPNFKGWDQKSFDVKLANTAQVIKDLGAEVVALQEIENENTLKELLGRLEKNGVKYPHYAITQNKKSAIQSVLLSKFPIVSYNELKVSNHYRERPILKATLQIGKDELIVYVNHWKAKTGPESKRLEFADTLAADIKRLRVDADFVALGDFNSNYNEMETIQNDKKLNDTGGLTGINHILKTAKSQPKEKPELAQKADVAASGDGRYLYNLWLEIPKQERVSEWFGKEKNTPDNMIISKGLFDKKGVSYVDSSFEVFRPSYLMKNGRAYRWEDAGESRAFSIPQGYSDHLPLKAKFKIGGFGKADQANPAVSGEKSQKQSGLKTVFISDLYGMVGEIDVLVKNVAVIYKTVDSAVLKQKNGRAIFVYNPPKELELGGLYDIRVGKVEDYRGLIEIKTVLDHKKIGTANVSEYYLSNYQDFKSPHIQNEVISGITGLYSRGRLVMEGHDGIKIYFKDKNLKPKNMTKILIKTAHIGFYNEPQIIINKPEDYEVAE